MFPADLLPILGVWFSIMTHEITVRPALSGYVQVSITIRGVTTVNTWKMTEAEAMAEAEEIVRRKAA